MVNASNAQLAVDSYSLQLEPPNYNFFCQSVSPSKRFAKQLEPKCLPSPSLFWLLPFDISQQPSSTVSTSGFKLIAAVKKSFSCLCQQPSPLPPTGESSRHLQPQHPPTTSASNLHLCVQLQILPYNCNSNLYVQPLPTTLVSGYNCRFWQTAAAPPLVLTFYGNLFLHFYILPDRCHHKVYHHPPLAPVFQHLPPTFNCNLHSVWQQPSATVSSSIQFFKEKALVKNSTIFLCQQHSPT